MRRLAAAFSNLSLSKIFLIILVIALIVGFFIPVHSVIPREHFEGLDQFQWSKVLQEGDPKDRPKAIFALYELMKRPSNKASVRSTAVHALVNANATEAIPDLQEMLQSSDEDLRVYARRALDQLKHEKN